MIMKKLLLAILPLLAISALARPVHASEGLFRLNNQVGDKARCSGRSVPTPPENTRGADSRFAVSLSCRDIVYPATGSGIVSYVVWARPLIGGDPVRIGTVGVGFVNTTVNTPFTGIFITEEKNANTESPTGRVVMSGDVRLDPFLDAPSQFRPEDELGDPIPTPSGEEIEEMRRANAINPLTTGLAAVLGIAAIIFLVIIVAKK